MRARTGKTSPQSLTAAGDVILVARAIDGDSLAFETLIRRYAPIMRAYAARIVGSPAEADDVVQDSFFLAWQRLPDIRDGAAVRAWLMRIVSRQAFTHLRRRRADVPLPLATLSSTDSRQPEQVAVRNAQFSALSAALDRLPDDQRQCWLLREVAELSYREIAEELAISPASVRGKLARARASVGADMEAWR
ncbi:RNA polymerase sigma factor [Agromyces sp. ISL-38]|nr:RNA polymerase sigma factor [Agromyces sp. ISL-38]